jgi:membrane-associated phospholipid phosphatase
MSNFFTAFVFFFCFSFLTAQNLDIELLKGINENRNVGVEKAMIGISNSVVPIAVGTPMVLYAVGIIKKDGLTKQKAIFVGQTVIASSFVVYALKEIVKRDRPYETYPEVDNVIVEDSYSFPSGHASLAFSTATSISMAYPKWYIIAPAFIWAGTVGYSRMYLGLHYPSDVLFGALIGSGSAFLCRKLNKWINKKRRPEQKKLWE